jgi:hypothetical protein
MLGISASKPDIFESVTDAGVPPAQGRSDFVRNNGAYIARAALEPDKMRAVIVSSGFPRVLSAECQGSGRSSSSDFERDTRYF